MTDKEAELSYKDWAKLKGLKTHEEIKDNYVAYQKELHAYWYQKKREQILNALESIKACGFKCWLQCDTNAHIQAKSKHGKILSYYATTGTIVGYYGTNINGVDCFIKLLEDI